MEDKINNIAFRIFYNRLKSYDETSKPYNVNVIVDLPGQPDLLMQRMVIGAENVKKAFEEAITYNPAAIKFVEFSSKSQSSAARPSDTYVVKFEQETPVQHTEIAKPTLGRIGNETLTVEAMAERIKSLNENLERERKEKEELEAEMDEMIEKSEKNGGFNMEKIGELAGLLIPVLSGNNQAATQQQAQLSGTDNEPDQIKELIAYFKQLDQDRFNKVFSVIHYMAKNDDNMDTIFSMISDDGNTENN